MAKKSLKRKSGRLLPSDWPDGALTELVTYISIGVPRADAAKSVGITPALLASWLRDDPSAEESILTLRKRIARQDGRGVAALVQTIHEAAIPRQELDALGQPVDVPYHAADAKAKAESARWLLARRRPEAFGRLADVPAAQQPGTVHVDSEIVASAVNVLEAEGVKFTTELRRHVGLSSDDP